MNFLFCSTDLCLLLCQYHLVLITVSFSKFLNRYYKPCFFFSPNCFGYSRSFHFYINFKSNLLISLHIDREYIHPLDEFGEIFHLNNILPIHKHLFRSLISPIFCTFQCICLTLLLLNLFLSIFYAILSGIVPQIHFLVFLCLYIKCNQCLYIALLSRDLAELLIITLHPPLFDCLSGWVPLS